MCKSNYPLVPLTIKTIVHCDDACNGRTGIKDDICCFNFICWPITVVLDLVLCPCLYGYYKYKKKIEASKNVQHNTQENNEIETEQPV